MNSQLLEFAENMWSVYPGKGEVPIRLIIGSELTKCVCVGPGTFVSCVHSRYDPKVQVAEINNCLNILTVPLTVFDHR